MLELVMTLSLVSLCSAWFASFFDRRIRLGFVPLWRRIVVAGALLSSTASLIILLYCYELVGRSALAFTVIVSLAECGLVFAAIAFVTCWFGSRKTLACLLPSIAFVVGSWFIILTRIV